MDYLNIEDGETVEVKIVWKRAKHYFRHWLGRRAVNCEEAGCQYCLRGNIARVKHILHVERDGREIVWIFSPSMLRTIKYLADDRDNLEGLVYSITRKNRGNRTEYHVVRIFYIGSEV